MCVCLHVYQCVCTNDEGVAFAITDNFLSMIIYTCKHVLGQVFVLTPDHDVITLLTTSMLALFLIRCIFTCVCTF